MKRTMILAAAVFGLVLVSCCPVKLRPVHCWPAVGRHRPTCLPPVQWTSIEAQRA